MEEKKTSGDSIDSFINDGLGNFKTAEETTICSSPPSPRVGGITTCDGRPRCTFPVDSPCTVVPVGTSCKSSNGKVTTCHNPSLGMTLVLSVFMFGLDRFYVGQIGVGVAFLIGCLSVIGLIIVVPIQIISQIALVMSILSNKQTCFMYGCNVIFDPPTIVDKILAILWLTLVIVGVILGSIGQLL